MNQELNRIKNDVETIQKAIGLSSLPTKEWAGWLKRDKWLNLWWCLPGAMAVAASFLPAGQGEKHFGLVPQQWAALVTTAVFFWVFWYHLRKTTANDGRPQDLIREYKRYWGIDSHGKWVAVTLGLGFLLFFAWALHFRIGNEAFLSGMLILFGMTYLVVALLSRIWLLLGLALPILACGFFMVLVPKSVHWPEIPIGITGIAVSLAGYFIQAGQIQNLERQHEAY